MPINQLYLASNNPIDPSKFYDTPSSPTQVTVKGRTYFYLGRFSDSQNKLTALCCQVTTLALTLLRLAPLAEPLCRLLFGQKLTHVYTEKVPLKKLLSTEEYAKLNAVYDLDSFEQGDSLNIKKDWIDPEKLKIHSFSHETGSYVLVIIPKNETQTRARKLMKDFISMQFHLLPVPPNTQKIQLRFNQQDCFEINFQQPSSYKKLKAIALCALNDMLQTYKQFQRFFNKFQRTSMPS